MVGTAVASSLLTPKPKLQAVDRGKLDDIRITVMEEGAFKPLAYGKRVRMGGVIRWGTPTQEYVTRTPGRSAGKGGGSRQAEPPANNFTYRKSFAILVCGNRIRRYRRIWEDIEVVFNDDGSDSFADFYEAELAALSGAAIVSDGTDYSGGRAVSLSTGGSVTFEGVRAVATGSNVLTIFYKATSSTGVTLLVNGVGSSVTLPSTGGAVGVVTVSRTLNRGGNEVAVFHSGLSAIALDRIHVRAPSGPVPDPRPVVTHVVDEGSPYPDDPDDPSPFYNAAISYDATGTATGTLTGGGQAPFEFYTGTETQLQSPIIIAAEGAANVPAWRGESGVVFDDYLIKSERGQLGNFTFEVEPYIQDLAAIVEDLYRQDNRLGAEEVDFSLLAGTIPDGFVVHTREQLSNWITQLQVWFNFDVLPLGGKVVAVPRGQSNSFTLTEADLWARRETDETPRGPIRRTIEDPADAPQSVDILYLDSSEKKDFHTAGEQAQASIGDAFDRDTLTFAIVSDGDTAVAVGRRYLDTKELEQRPFEFATGPKFRHLSPTDVGTIVLPDVTHTVRLTSKSAELQSLIKWKAVPERASLYNQTFPAQLSLGRETPTDAFPANTLLAVTDCVPLRKEDLSKLVVYGAGCARGRGAWRGFAFNKVGQTGDAERLGSTQKAATMGVVETASQGSVTSGYQSARYFVVKLYFDGGGIESRTLADVQADRLNVALYGSGSRWEVLQFVSAVPQVPTFPFVAQYLVTGVVTGIYGTQVFANLHADGDTFLLLDEAVQAFEVRPDEVGLPVTFIGQTFGQAYADAEVASSVTVTLKGVSQQYPKPGVTATKDTLGNWRLQLFGTITTEAGGERYKVEIDGSPRQPWVLRSDTARPVTLADGSVLGVGSLDPPGSGESSYVPADLPGNSIGGVGYVQQLIRGERTVLSFEFTTVLTSASPTAGPASVTFSPGGSVALQMFVRARTSTETPFLRITDSEHGSPLFEDTDGEPSGTHYSVEFVDGKVKFYRNRGRDTAPFYTHSVTNPAFAFPLEVQFLSPVGLISWEEIEIEDAGAAINYNVAEQVADFGSAQASITVRACQQKVIQGVVIDGQITEVTFP